MFTIAQRDRVRERLLELAESDPGVAAAAITGSYATGEGDEWSDIDLAFAIPGQLAESLDRWTELLYGDFGALHRWDLPWGSTVYRVFLLPDCLEVDIAFAPVAEFGPRGPKWRAVFGESVDVTPSPPPRSDDLVGLAWHHVLHARACIERGKPWQAEWLISGVRDHVLTLACLRLGLTTSFAKGTDLLPPEVTEPVEATLVRSIDEVELRRALGAAVSALTDELKRTEPELAIRLQATLVELTTPGRLSGRPQRSNRAL
jgi:hypothetical protein